MKDLMGMMGKVKELQDKMESLQQEIEEIEADGQAGGGLVRVTLSGKGQLKALSIDPSLLKPDEAEILEDLIVAAHTQAKAHVDDAMREKQQSLTSGLPIPPGFKLPF